jgi:outer membrane murein-binding lipoprotein Lpp
MYRLLALPLAALLLSGCIAQTAVDIVTLPVKAASKTVDVLTTSQSEADEKRGRAMRKHEECLGKEERRAKKEKREPDPSRCPAR